VIELRELGRQLAGLAALEEMRTEFHLGQPVDGIPSQEGSLAKAKGECGGSPMLKQQNSLLLPQPSHARHISRTSCNLDSIPVVVRKKCLA